MPLLGTIQERLSRGVGAPCHVGLVRWILVGSCHHVVAGEVLTQLIGRRHYGRVRLTSAGKEKPVHATSQLHTISH